MDRISLNDEPVEEEGGKTALLGKAEEKLRTERFN